jgi:hypothetical protein
VNATGISIGHEAEQGLADPLYQSSALTAHILCACRSWERS